MSLSVRFMYMYNVTAEKGLVRPIYHNSLPVYIISHVSQKCCPRTHLQTVLRIDLAHMLYIDRSNWS